MPPVACCIDQNVIRLPLQSAFDHCLQIFIFNLKFLKRKIVHINDKFVVSVLDLRDYLIQILKLMLVNLDDS